MNVLQDKVEALEISLGSLSPRDRAFAENLIYDFRKYKRLSEKQAYWVGVLLDRALGVAPPPPQVAKAEVGELSKVYALFQKAKQKLKFPKLRLQVGDLPVVISVAGERSKYAGNLQLSDGGPFGDNRYYGNVSPDGAFQPSRREEAVAPQIGAVLKALGDDPLAVVKEYGRLVGVCSFCGKKLKDEQSVAAGYGPVCAANFGLKAEYKAAESVLA